MHIVTLSNEEIDIIHTLILHAMDANSSRLPPCTWGDGDCIACNLLDKFYNIWKETH